MTIRATREYQVEIDNLAEVKAYLESIGQPLLDLVDACTHYADMDKHGPLFMQLTFVVETESAGTKKHYCWSISEDIDQQGYAPNYGPVTWSVDEIATTFEEE